MIIYSVTIEIKKNVETDWLEWMQAVHVPDVLATNLFVSAVIQRHLFQEANARFAKYTIRYELESLQKYEIYQEKYAPQLQKEHTERYAGWFSGSRAVMELV